MQPATNFKPQHGKVIVKPPRPGYAPPRQTAIEEVSCLVMLGGAGDILNTLPLAKHFSGLDGATIPFITARRHLGILEGASYIRNVVCDEFDPDHYPGAIAWARRKFSKVYPLNLGGPEVLQHQLTSSFCYEPYALAGVPTHFRDTLPLIFDRRNTEREAILKKRIVNERPLFLYNLLGLTSPLACDLDLERRIHAVFKRRLNLVNTSALRLSNYHDLLGLLDEAVGMITVDTATLHLAPASKTPYIALVNDTKTPWWTAVPRGNVALRLGYRAVPASFDLIINEIEAMIANPIITKPKVKLVTIASGPIAPVWDVARKTWERYAKHHGYELVVRTTLPDIALAPSWNKCLVVADELEKDPNCVVWWIDSDTIALKLDQAIEVETDKDLLISTDFNGICCGIFRAANTPWVRSFLRAVPMLGDVADSDKYGRGHGPKWEQNAIKALSAEFPAVANKIGTIPRTFVFENTGRKAEGLHPSPTHLIAHYGGRPMEARIRQINEDLPPILERMDARQRVSLRTSLLPQPRNEQNLLTSRGEVCTIINLIESTSGDILEIGCSSGQTTKLLALAFPDRLIHAVDWTAPASLANSKQIIEKPAIVAAIARNLPNVRLYDHDSKTFRYPPKIGAVFLDAEHTYEAVRADSENAWNYPSPLLIIWHDVHSPHFEGPTRYLEECVGAGADINYISGTMLAYATNEKRPKW